MVTLFVPGIDTGPPGAAEGGWEELGKVGWTEFVPGTHTVEGAAAALADPAAWATLRPRLRPGDGVVYDARLLHRGLANRSRGTARPLLYASFTRGWFRDAQNWGDESLFEAPRGGGSGAT